MATMNPKRPPDEWGPEISRGQNLSTELFGGFVFSNNAKHYTTMQNQ